MLLGFFGQHPYRSSLQKRGELLAESFGWLRAAAQLTTEEAEVRKRARERARERGEEKGAMDAPIMRRPRGESPKSRERGRGGGR